MQDEYSYLRAKYEEIVRHCEYLLHSTADTHVLAKAHESKQWAAKELIRLNRQLAAIPRTNS